MPVPSSISHFRVEGLLGEGGMGVVYRAVDVHLKRPVALKVLPASIAGDPERRQRFLREARAAAAVSHPNIATIYEVGEEDGLPFIAMELVDGKSVRALLRDGMSRSAAWRIARGVVVGLSKAHERGIAHRDLKPENVMVTPDGDVKLLDFGLAKVFEDESHDQPLRGSAATVEALSVEGRWMGTPAYMSPEQAAALPNIDARTDIFSFGVFLFELLTSKQPFGGSTPVEVLYAVMHHRAPTLGEAGIEASETASALIARCLQKQPEARFASARDLLAALDAISVHGERDAPKVTRAKPPAATALDATMQSDEPVLHPSAGRSKAGAHGVWRTLAVIIAIGAGLAMARLVAKPATSAKAVGAITASNAVNSTSSSASASAVSSIGPWPLPSSDKPDALALYVSGTQKLRDGWIAEGFTDLVKARTLDPLMAAAYVPAIVTGSGNRGNVDDDAEALRRVLPLRGRLDDRERRIVEVAQLAFGPMPHPQEAADATAKLEHDFPADCEVALLRVRIESAGLRQPKQAWSTLKSAIARDAKCSGWLWAVGFVLPAPEATDEQGQHAATAAWARACLAQWPDHPLCRLYLAQESNDESACLAAAEQRLSRTPGSAYLLQRVIWLREARRDPTPELEEMLGRMPSMDGIKLGTLELQWARARLHVMRGAFDSALEDLARIGSDSVGPEYRFEHEVLVALTHALVAYESGDRLTAARLARSQIKRARLFPGASASGAVALLNYARLDSNVAGLRADALTLATASEPAASDHSRRQLDLALTENSADAERALASTRTLPIRGLLDLEGWRYGRAAELAGDTKLALFEFENGASLCRGAGAPEEYVFAAMAAGRLLQASGDKEAACRYFDKVLFRWGHARPRSITAEEARRRSDELHCPTAGQR